MKKKLFDIFFIAAFLVLCTALSVGTWLFGPAQAAANEKLAEMPAFVTEEGSINRDYLSQLQNFVNDRFFLRQQLITLDRRFSICWAFPVRTASSPAGTAGCSLPIRWAIIPAPRP
jgi:hypothetical protein